MTTAHARKAAFTLVELLVVIAIIALLLAALLPAISVIKNKAKVADTQAVFGALATGIETYRGEQAIGASLPPSTGDNSASGADRREIATPPPLESESPMKVAGAHLLVLAMMGDGLGTAGFKDVGDQPGWWDNTHKAEGGLYYIEPGTGKEKHARYGPYVDDKLRARAKGLDELAAKGGIVGPGDPNVIIFIRAKLPVFLDSWDRPILYYKASPSVNRMVADGATPGIYRQADNNIITGSDGTQGEPGLDFGGGADPDFGDMYHALAKTVSPQPTDKVDDIISDDSEYRHSFVKFILDPKTKSRPTPVNRDGYLLISAGPDAQYGTTDDLTNWVRETN